MANETVNYDVEGYDVITNALLDLINEYPRLAVGDSISFLTLSENKGKAMFPLSGAIIQREIKDIVGGVEQTCNYPFYIIYRAGSLNAKRKNTVKEWLDDLGRWLEKQPIKVDESYHRLEDYPKLAGNRRFLEIRRTTPATLNAIKDNNTEDWVISITARYINSF